MSRLATVREVVLERTPTRRDWWAIGWLGCLLLAAFSLRPVTDRLPEVLLQARLLALALALLGPPAVVGYRRTSPVVAVGVAYCFAAVGLYVSGSWRLTLGGAPDWEYWFHYRTLVLYGPGYGLVLAAVGYPAGLVAYGVRRVVRAAGGDAALTRS